MSSYRVGIISASAAVFLWLVATWFEDDSRWLPAAGTRAIETNLQSKRTDTPVRANTDVLSCEQVEAALEIRVGKSQYCIADDDCTLFDYGYPIQCLTSVAKSEITALRLAYRRYEQSCAYRVYYDCPSGETARLAVCRSNRCEVELTSIDPLQEKTLQHLGIEKL